MLIKKKLSKIFSEAVKELYSIEIDAMVELPRNPEHGDYATNAAMVIVKKVGKKPIDIANEIISKVDQSFFTLEAANPGFINIRINNDFIYNNLKNIDENYGKNKELADERILIEYVSANPTGPLHIGHGRWAAIGSTITNMLVWCGASVEQEFYVNDAGRQIRLLGESVWFFYRHLKDGTDIDSINKDQVPEDYYQGAYIKHIAVEFYNRNKDYTHDEVAQMAPLKLLDEQKVTLAKLNTVFDNYYSEKTLHDDSKGKSRVIEAIDKLRENGDADEQDNALWFRSTKYGDDKDRVIRKENGELTYMAADIAYHLDKINRRYTRLINIWGADHHGYVPRIKAVISSFGYDPNHLEVLLGQLVYLFRDGEPVRMSKRTGEMITLDEVIDEIGVDATRYTLLSKSIDTSVDFDMAKVASQSLDNPVFYLQYAHARICSILANAAEQNISYSDPDLSVLTDESERALGLLLLTLPQMILDAAGTREPHRIIHISNETARAFHSFYTRCRILNAPDEATVKARLYLCDRTRTALDNLSKILAIKLPERM